MGGEEKRVAAGAQGVCVGKEGVSSNWEWWGCMWSNAPSPAREHTGNGEEGKCGLRKWSVGGEMVK